MRSGTGCLRRSLLSRSCELGVNDILVSLGAKVALPVDLDKAALSYRQVNASVFTCARLLQPSTCLHVKALRKSEPELLRSIHGLFCLATTSSCDFVIYVAEILGNPVYGNLLKLLLQLLRYVSCHQQGSVLEAILKSPLGGIL